MSNSLRSAFAAEVRSRTRSAERVHAIIQFEKIPTEAQKKELAARGIQLQSYLPHFSWVANISASGANALSEDQNVRWAGFLLPEDKLAAQIRQSELTAAHYNPATGRVAVIVQFHRDVELRRARERIVEVGGEANRTIHSIHAITVHIPRDRLVALAQLDEVMYIEPPQEFGLHNDGVRAAHSVNAVQALPYDLDGTGIDVLVYDGGQVADHTDFGPRLIHGDTALNNWHATHVAGTLGGDGSRSAAEGGTPLQWRGVATNADLISYGFEPTGGEFFYVDVADIEADWDEAKNIHGADMGTASLGSNTAANGYSCTLEGQYGAAASLLDAIIRGSLGEPYVTTWSAGNERGGAARCGAEFGTTAPPSCAKNPIIVGASNSNDNSMTNFSSWGPCDDGRLRPVVTAGGCQTNGDFALTSTDEFDGYTAVAPIPGTPPFCGTSMSTPAVAGVVALMLQAFREEFATDGEFLPSSAKAILMNTAADAGNVGPDFQFGYGLVNAQEAVDVVQEGRFRESQIEAAADIKEYSIFVTGGTAVLQVSLAWDDPSVSAMSADALVNDLDLELISPSSVVHDAWVLNPASPGDAATTGDDDDNNMEQVTVNGPEAGTWIVRVTGELVPDGPQKFSLAATGELIDMEIVSPTAGAPLDVGSNTDPEPMLVRLDITNRFGGPPSVPIVPALDLDLEVNGLASTIIMGEPVGNEYWVLILPPDQIANGCYNLEVTLFDKLVDLETTAVCYGPSIDRDVILVTDRSFSMSPDNKLVGAKDAAQFFISAMSNDDKIGATSFSTTGTKDFELTTITGAAEKTAVSGIIEGYIAAGNTAIGEGMNLANTEMNTDGHPDHIHSLVLLSDGHENSGTPRWPAVHPLIPADTIIHTIALGPLGDPDEPLMQSIASDFNGTYSRVYSGAGSGGTTSLATTTVNMLSDSYRRAAEEVFGWERMFEAAGRVGACTPGMPSLPPASHTVSVESGLQEIIFAAQWDPGFGTTRPLTLRRPDGTTVLTTALDVIEHRTMGAANTSGHQQYRMRTPMPGTWTMTIAGQSCAEYLVLVEAKSKTKLLILDPPVDLVDPDCTPQPIRAVLYSQLGKLRNATVTARITSFGGYLRTLTLFDDGLHGDSAAQDGIYGNTFVPCPPQSQPPQGETFEVKVSSVRGLVRRSSVQSFSLR